MSSNHLQRYLDLFAGRQGVSECNTIEPPRNMVAKWVGKRLLYRDLPT